MYYDLDCRYDSRKSFYGKAKVKESRYNGLCLLELYSYGTLVAKIEITTNGKKTYIYMGNYSQTTTRHQKEFFKQEGLDDNDIKELFKRRVLII